MLSLWANCPFVLAKYAYCKVRKIPCFWWQVAHDEAAAGKIFLDFVLVYYEKVSKFVFIPTCFNNFIFHKWQNVFSFCCVQEICTTQAHLQSKMSHNQIKGAIRLVDNWLAEQENSKMIVSCHIDCTKANHIIEIWIWEKFIFRPLIHCRVSGEVKVIGEVDAVGKKFQILHFFAFECL